MNETYIRQLVERFLNAETTLEEEQMLYNYFQGEDIAEDLMPYREVFQSFSAVNGMDKEIVKTHTPVWVTLLRTATTMAAVFLIGLFFAVQGENNEVPQQTMATNQTGHTPDLCEGSTPRELYMCYLERKREQSKTYRSLKRMIYENQQ
ncbi:MAG: hypothetical protein IKQ77_09070 [Prevotella sp.]|nr:hypothetical protein [Prevotella sp.]